MDALTIFKRCRAADEDIERLERMVQRKRDRMRSLGGMRMDANGGGRGSGDADRMGTMAAALDEAERKKRDRIEAKIAEMMAADILIGLVPDLEGEILERYYLNGSTLAETARKMHLSEGYVRTKKRDADMAAELISEERVDAALPGWYLTKWKKRR